ncbi:hypothetical protein FPQ18DRAFT_330294 [Pyronema domesticum]|nr:hypothetical protein FPQ18DRAFT_330294 [Pyronema domesticum]
MQTYLEPGEKNNTLAKASTVLADILPHSEYENWGTWRVYPPHVTALLAHLMVEDSDSVAIADLCMKAGWYLIELGRYSESLILYERARKLYAFLFGEENTKTLYSMDSIGTSFIYCERLKEGQGILEKVLEVRRRTVGEEHPNNVTSIQNLAITYTEPGGSMKKVQELEEKALEVRRRTLGEDHPDTVITMQNLAETYKDLGGRLNEVQQIQEEVLEVRKRILGEDHQDTANAMYNLEVTLHNLGRLDEAIVLMEEAARSYSRTYGSDHSEKKDAERVAKRWKDEIKQDDGGAD